MATIHNDGKNTSCWFILYGYITMHGQQNIKLYQAVNIQLMLYVVLQYCIMLCYYNTICGISCVLTTW
jgi:hypothetical protein